MKNYRQAALIDLIKNKAINTQEGLQLELNKMGYNVTQATVSRDVKALNIIKILDNDGNYRYSVNDNKTNDNNRYIDIFSKSVISITPAMNDVVVKCYAGTASAAATAIDNLYSDLFIGTLAGDDTIFIVTKSPQDATILVNKLNTIL